MGYEVQTDDAGPLKDFYTYEDACEFAGKVLDDILSDPDDNEEHVSIVLNCNIADIGRISEVIRHDDKIDFEKMGHPTAEWSRIQQALKERDELAAELERVKAERDSARGQAAQWHELYGKKKKKLSDLEIDVDSLKSRLPENRDGNVVLWGDTQFVPVGDKPEVVEFTVEVLGVDSFGNWYSMMSGEKVYLAGCHSTAESCRAANTQAD